MKPIIDTATIEQLFTQARTYAGWLDKPVTDAQLRQMYEMARWAPTSANNNPMRVVFIRSQAAKDKLKLCLSAGNVEKTMSAPVTAIVAEDHLFYEHLPRLFPHMDLQASFVGKPETIAAVSHYNTTLQAAYLIIAARALGLDCGPMAGFDQQSVDEHFFAGTSLRSNVLINMGYGDTSKLYPRGPRFEFDEVCQVIG